MFIVLEGSDCSGKTTLFRLQGERLRAAGHNIDIYDFPRYDEPSSYFIKRYLNGDYGPAAEVSPYTASFFFALDRYEAAPLIRRSLAKGKVVIANRFSGSNMAHQGAKFSKTGEQRGYFLWADSLEFQLMGIPRPDLNIFLRVPAEISYELIKQKAKRSYTNKTHDEHEGDIEHLKRSVAAYDMLCELYPKDFKAIECVKLGKLLPVTVVNNLVWDSVKPMLPEPTLPGHSAVINLEANTEVNPEPAIRGPKREFSVAKPPVNITDIKDISLLLLSRLQGRGLDLSYRLDWPSVRKPRLDYYIPNGLSPKLAKKYKSGLDKIAALNRQVRERLPEEDKELADMTIPLAALTDAQANGQRQVLAHLLSEIEAMGFEEARQVSKRPAPKNQNPKTLEEIIRQINDSRLGSHGATPENPVILAGVYPRNEFDLLADSLYAFSNNSRSEITAQLDSMNYQQKAEAIKALCIADEQGMLNKALYQFDVIGDLREMERLIELLQPVETKIQPPTVRYGYGVPKAVEDTGLADEFIECFDTSLELFSELQAAGHEVAASYAVLFGHRQRWRLNLNGESIYGGRNSDTPSVAKLVKIMRQLAAESHPLIAAAVAMRQKTDTSNRTSNNRAKTGADRKRPRNKHR
jgi:dTMP kinase